MAAITRLLLALALGGCAAPHAPLKSVTLAGQRTVEARSVTPDGKGNLLVEVKGSSGRWITTRWPADKVR